MTSKGPDAFRTISEAAAEVGVEAHVLRYWETQFEFLRPVKRKGGRRLYRPADIHLLNTLRRLLHEEGLSIRAVRAFPRRAWIRASSSPGPASGEGGRVQGRVAARAGLQIAYTRAVAAKHRLDRLLAPPSA